MRKLTVEDLNRIDVQTFRQADKLPLVMVLDNIRSLHNVGSVLRTADAFRIEAVVMCGITATPPSAEIHKTALGAEDSVSWRHCDDTLEAVRQLQEAGAPYIATSTPSTRRATWCSPSNRWKEASNWENSSLTPHADTPS